MDIWNCSSWECNVEICQHQRSGLRFRFQQGVNKDVRRACIDFGKWLRIKYYFPIRLMVYLKSSEYIKASDGDYVSAIFFEPYNKSDEPYIKISTGDYQKMKEEWGNDNALGAILGSVAHEITHYYQWINDIKLTESGLEKQASYYRKKIINEYAKTREHP